MNEFIEQFIVESRELIEQALGTLSVLEQSPRDKERIDEIFRAFHTLKGSAGIVDFTAMEQAVHALESGLSEARSGADPISSQLIGNCVACLDQVSRWLDIMERTGELPADAQAQASAIVARIDSPDGPALGIATKTDTLESWVVNASSRHPEHKAQAKTAVQFTPAADCFFKGQDPLALIASLPGLLSVDMVPVNEWPPLDVLDPFECVSVLTALVDSSIDDARKHLGTHAEQCEFVSLSASGPEVLERRLSPSARKLLEAQIALVSNVDTQHFVGCVASAGIVAGNVLRHHGYDAVADLIVGATEESLRNNSPRQLEDQIRQALALRAEINVEPNIEQISTTAEALPRTLRIETERVDLLVRLTGELTVVKNAIGHAVKRKWSEPDAQLSALKEHHGVLERLIGELQKSVLGMRVLPLRTVLQRFPRVIREMSKSLGKPANIVIEGDHTEADKAIVEMLFEPLLHVVRNAMDHGVETAEVRTQKNKPAVATIHMRASRQGDHVIIEVADDGSGIDVERIRLVAKQRGIVAADVLEQITDEEAIDLIFAPGFTTASQVTELSGRGVGMDAVRMTVERIGGRVAIASRSSQGTTVTFTLPYSVMMTDVMSVEAGGQLYGIPLDAVVETLRVSLDKISAVGAAKVLVHRNRTIPVFELPKILQSQDSLQVENEVTVVVATIAGQWGGFQVDRLGDRLAVMLKPLDGLLANTPGIAGTTIMGDGRVLLVLDLAGVL